MVVGRIQMSKGIHILFDGNNTAYRCNCVTELYTKDGRRSSAVHGTLNTTHSTIEKLSEMLSVPVKEVIYGWDFGHNPRRTSLFPEYKGDRHKDDNDEEKKQWRAEFYSQTNDLHDNLPYFGVKSYMNFSKWASFSGYRNKSRLSRTYPLS